MEAEPSMPRLLFLDDDPARAKRFLACNPSAELVTTAEGCIARLEEPWDEVHLDHDLGGEVYVNSCRADCGMEVVRWIVARPCEPLRHTLFVVHSHNVRAAGAMLRELREHGLECVYRPFGMNVEEWLADLDIPDAKPVLPRATWRTRIAAAFSRLSRLARSVGGLRAESSRIAALDTIVEDPGGCRGDTRECEVSRAMRGRGQ